MSQTAAKAISDKLMEKSRERWLSSRLTVLIVTDNPGASHDIVADVRKIGLDVQIAYYDGHKLAATPNEPPSAILCFFTDYLEKTPAVCAVLRKYYAPKELPIIGAMMRPSAMNTDHFDTVIFAPIHSSQIANRVDAMIRIGQMEVEISRRIQTFQDDFGITNPIPRQYLDRQIRILFIGKATPAFMVIVNALQKKNIEVVAAFTSFSAFDYLHEQTFDAVVMNAVSDPEPALTISETMRRNAQLYHVPSLLLIDPKTFEYDRVAYAQGVRDLLPIDAETEEVSGRIIELANYHRIHEQLKQSFNSLTGTGCIDEDTGLFNEEFFTAHLDRLCKDCTRMEQDLTLLAIHPTIDNVDSVAPHYLNQALIKVGSMLKNLVRMQDVVARVDKDIFVLAFPNASEAVVENILTRINGLADCAAFETGRAEQPSFTFALNASIVQRAAKADGAILFQQTLAKLSANIAKTPQFMAS